MTEPREQTPLTTGKVVEPSLFPPISSNKQNGESGSSYGVIEITPAYLETSERKSSKCKDGIFSSPFVAAVALAVGIALILTITFSVTGGNSHEEQAVLKAGVSKSNSSPVLSQSLPHVDIEIPQGRLRGYKRLSRQKREYNAFYKVPYAAPPLGSLRFKNPVPPSNWNGLRDIPTVAPQCIQKEKYSSTNQAVGEEDCLYANIYTPYLPEGSNSNLLPVMVYVHGGGVQGNGSRYGADYMMDEDVVLITFQFRLGALGQLSTGDDVIRGNMGQKDQVQMLKWVKDNVQHFNGDPNLVTIFGNSMGGMAVGYLTLSPMTSGLFHRAISQSGASMCYSLPDDPEEARSKTLKEVGSSLGCDPNDSEQFLECLRGKDAKDIALVLNSKTQYTVTIEDWEGDDSKKFLAEKPYKILESGRNHAVPYLIGNTNAEWYGTALSILQDELDTDLINKDFSRLIEADLNKEEYESIREFYFGDELISNQTFREFGDMVSDSGMVHCCYVSARFHAKQSDTFLYWVTKPPYLSYIEKSLKGFPAKELGLVHHADELQFMFLYYGYPEITQDDPEYFEFSAKIVKLWVNFARTGNGSVNDIEWTSINGFGDGFANSTYWLELNDNPRLIPGPQERMGFWDRFSHVQLKYDK